MKKLKKLLSVILVATMVLTTFSIGITASAESTTTETGTTADSPLEVVVTTNKSDYGKFDVAEITVTVTNTSDETVENISAEAVFNDLAPCKQDSSETFKEIEDLNPGESFSFSYKATLSLDNSDVGFFSKIILWFVRLFNDGYTIVNGNSEADIENVTKIKFGKYLAKNFVKVIHTDSVSSDEELKKMDYVLNAISDYTQTEEYKSLTQNEDKVQSMQMLLNDLEKEGLIIKGSIQYSKESNAFFYKHSNGITSFVFLDSFNSMYVGTKEITSTKNTSTSNTSQRLNNSIRKSTDLTNTVFMYGFDKSDEPYSYYNKYDTLMKEYSKKGLIPTIYNNPSVEDYKTAFTETNYICIIEHGTYFPELGTSGFAVIGDEETIGKYSGDIDEKRIISGTVDGHKTYIITPKFFEHYYKDNQLDNAVVFLFCCQGFGANGTMNYDFANAFHSCGASAVIGFHNTVFEGYAYSIYTEFTDNMLKGYSVNESLDKATEVYGKNDIEYGAVFFPQSEYWEKVDPKTGNTWKHSLGEKNVTAYPVLSELTFSVSGTVKDEMTGNAISGVRVEFIDNSSDSLDPVATATTDTNGLFSVKLPYGSYSLSFNHDDYEYYGTTVNVDTENVDLTEPVLLMPKTNYCSIRTTVKDDTTQNVIPGVTVKLINSESGETVLTTATDENGEAVVKFAYGKYTLSFIHNDYEILNKNINVDSKLTATVTVATFKMNPVLLTPKNSSGGGSEDDRTVIDSGSCGADGDNVKWTLYDDGELVLSGSGKMADYSSSYAPWYSARESIAKVIIDEGVTTIGSYAFYTCTSLTSITIPDKLTTIGVCAFLNCTSLKSIIIPDSVTTIGSSAFDCCSLTDIEVSANNTVYSSIDGVLFNKNKTVLIYYPSGKTATSYTIPNSVITIGDSAFSYCSLTSITIPDSVKTINEYAFMDTRLTSITIPDSVTTIGDYAFYLCGSLTSVTIGDGVTTIGDEAFSRCGLLTSITIGNRVTRIGNFAFENCYTLSKITIPNSVTTIGTGAFWGCNSITSITIPDSVKTIGDYAFYNCGYLANVYYTGSKEQWNAISIGSDNSCLTNATIHYNS